MTTYSQPKNPWLVVAIREIMVKITDKTFWISTIAMLVMVGIGFAMSFFFNPAAKAAKIGVVDDEGKAVVAVARERGVPLEAIQVTKSDMDQKIRDEDVALVVVKEGNTWQIRQDGPKEATKPIQDAIQQYVVASNAKQQGIDLKQLNAGGTATIVDISKEDAGGAVIAVVSVAFSILFLISAMTYGLQIAQSVVEEKESRIVEILVAAIPIRHLLAGKVIGNSIMALVQLVLLLSAALIALSQTPMSGLLPQIVPTAGWFVVFFLLGFATLACLWAGAGALATRFQDLNMVTTPLTMMLMMAYFAGLFVSGAAAKWLAYVPIVSTILMPKQLLTGQASWLDALIAIAVALAFMALAIGLGTKIYRRGVMNTGGTLKWGQVLKMSD